MATPLSICYICDDPHTGTANLCDDCARYERVTNAWLAREQRRFRRLSDEDRAAVVAVRGHLAELRHYEQGGM